MSKTRDELVNEALTRLGALPAGQTAESEDYAEVDGKVEPMLDDLSQRDITISGPTTFEDAHFLHLAAILAYHCRGYFGIVGQEAADLMNGAELAERKLKFYGRGTTQNRPVANEYF